MNAREFRISRGPFLKELAKDAEAMSAATFRRKHGVEVRECPVKLRRLKELAAGSTESTWSPPAWNAGAHRSPNLPRLRSGDQMASKSDSCIS